jgi:hypothetical protein
VLPRCLWWREVRRPCSPLRHPRGGLQRAHGAGDGGGSHPRGSAGGMDHAILGGDGLAALRFLKEREKL